MTVLILADERKAAGTPDDWGIAFSAAKFIGDSVMPFFRAGYADDITALLEATIATGIGYFKQNNSDLFAIGFAWGRPADNSLDDQYTVEMFYRLQLSQNIAISPDIQLLINPALNPDEDIIAVFGLRGRVAL
jgi:porin